MLKNFFIGIAAIGALPILLVALYSEPEPLAMQTPEQGYDVPYKYQRAFRAAHKAAQDNQRGLWSPNTCNGTAKSNTSAPPQAQAAPDGDPIRRRVLHVVVSRRKVLLHGVMRRVAELESKYLKSFDSLEARQTSAHINYFTTSTTTALRTIAIAVVAGNPHFSQAWRSRHIKGKF